MYYVFKKCNSAGSADMLRVGKGFALDYAPFGQFKASIIAGVIVIVINAIAIYNPLATLFVCIYFPIGNQLFNGIHGLAGVITGLVHGQPPGRY
jgi:hypothetical protein